MGQALRGQRLYDEKLTCRRESSYYEMLERLGDAQGQEEIRAESPDDRHCRLLVADPSACTRCQIKDNPYKNGTAEDVAVAMRNPELLIEARELYDQFELRLLERSDILALQPDEVAALRMVQRFEAVQLASMAFGGMVGGKDE